MHRWLILNCIPENKTPHLKLSEYLLEAKADVTRFKFIIGQHDGYVDGRYVFVFIGYSTGNILPILRFTQIVSLNNVH